MSLVDVKTFALKINERRYLSTLDLSKELTNTGLTGAKIFSIQKSMRKTHQ